MSLTVFLVVALPAVFGFAWFLRGMDLPGGGPDRMKGKPTNAKIKQAVGARAARQSAEFLRPGLESPGKAPMEEVGIRIGPRATKMRPRPVVYAKLEDCQIIMGPPRQGKTRQLKSNIILFPGAVVASSTKLDIIKDTNGRRRRNRGPTYLFNPELLNGKPSTLKWNPIVGCDDPQVARQRAAYFMSAAAARGGHSDDKQFWADHAYTVLRAYLFVAAHMNVSLMVVKKWANKASDLTALTYLQRMGDAAPAGWAEDVAQILNEYDKFKGSVFATLIQTFRFLDSDGAQEIVDVKEGERSFDARRFLKEKGTLYLIGANKNYGSIAPLFCALTGMIYETAKEMALANGGRLDPPCLFALDEAPNIVPLPLHEMTSEAGSHGIPIITCIQSRRQLIDVWGSAAADIIWENSTGKLILRGSSDLETLEMISGLIGKYDYERRTDTTDKDGRKSVSTVTESKVVLEPSDIRTMPKDHALYMAGGDVAVEVKVGAVWEERWFRRAEAKARKMQGNASTPPPRATPPPTQGGRPAQPTEHIATIYELPRHTAPDEKAGEQSG